MEEAVRRAIAVSLAEVFETMFFTLLEPLSAIPPREEWGDEQDFVGASLSFDGPVSGRLHFYLPRPLARSITGNFLGDADVEVSEAQIFDTVREAVNMAVGSMLGRIDPEGHCMLGIPEAYAASDFSPEAVVADLGLSVFKTGFGHLWVTCIVKSTESRTA